MNSSDQKPDLLSGAHSGGKRILASLEHGPAPVVAPDLSARRRLNSWTAGVLALLLLMSVLAWQSHRRATAPAPAPPAPAPASAPAARLVPAQAVASAPTPAPDDMEPEIISAATIYNDELITTPVTVARPASGPAPAPVPAPVRAGTQTPDMATVMARPQAATPGEQRERSAAPQSAARHSATSPARSAQHTPSPAAGAGAGPASASSADSDVALLTALVAHAYAPTTVTPERSRDVVVRKEDDSTATLLLRCKQLGLIEGMLCRSRICSDRWDADAACRAPPR